MCKTILFYDQNFPINGSKPSSLFFETLDDSIIVMDALSLAGGLKESNVDCLINFHGPYFPKNAWSEIYAYLQQGKGLLHIGGAPFKVPCNYVDGKWEKERAQTAYHQQLNIHETLLVKADPILHFEHNKEIPILQGKENFFTVQDTYNFILHVTKSSSIEKEMGSVGPMDARIYPLLKGVSKSGRVVASPSVLIENMKGTFAGGRWVFINQTLDNNFWRKEGEITLKELSSFVKNGVTEIWLKTNYPTYYQGERPQVTYQLQHFSDNAVHWKIKIHVNYLGEEIYAIEKYISVSNQLNRHSFLLPIDISPGDYHITCYAQSNKGEIRVMHQGFWGMDRKLLQEGSSLTCDRDYFRKDNRPMPIVGMTYMTSDVARYFLFLPNPSVWDRDMAQMKKTGINYIRTGIWTAWRNMMFVDGHVDETVLRSIDAFILCAKKHDLEVTFTFFSFTPEAWEGENPYLDSRSVEAQKRFISSIVSRHKRTTNINWDLINEPSLFDPNRTFAGPRSLHDTYDRKEFRKWLEKKHKSIQTLQEKWNMTSSELPSFDVIEPPEPVEINFSIRDMLSEKKGLKWLDYTLYSIEMHNRWTRELTDCIKQIAPNQLVTVGQDEALGGQRPSPLFYSEAVDYTTNHTWWLMDQLVWDGIFTKTPLKPNLIQETGIMYVENPNNEAKRSEEELRNILERKYAYSFSTGGAGAVQWLWNTNYYMNNVNESNIGAIRADGTEKPETNVSYDFGSFMKITRNLFQGRKLEDIAVIFPYSNDFSNRRLALRATMQLTRILAYEMNIPFRAISEYHLEALDEQPPKLLIIPSPHNFDNQALKEIIDFVNKKKTTLLFTGPISLDAYWHHTDRLQYLIGNSQQSNLVREEVLEIDGEIHPVSFGGESIAELLKENVYNDKSGRVQEYKVGCSTIIWSPLPVELNERIEPIKALYNFAIEKSGIEQDFIWVKGDYSGTYGRKLAFKQGALFIFVSEYAEDTTIQIKDNSTGKQYAFLLEAERVVMFTVDEAGKITAIYRPEEISVEAING